MPVAGSTAASPTGRTVVSTPASEAAASRVACSLGVVVISAFSWALLRCGRAFGQQKAPRATGTEGSARRSGTDALGDYDAAAAAGVQTGAGHADTVRLAGRGRQPGRLTQWTPPSIFRRRATPG